MSDTQHTPGPWFTLRGAGPHQKGAHIIRSAGGKCEVARASEQFMCRAERLANARLIAAAPDLLAEARNALNVLAGLATGDLKSIGKDSPAILGLRTAIAKATAT